MDVLRATPPAEGLIAHPQDPARRPDEPRVFVGTIGSANKLLRNALLRDRMRDKFKIRAFEMESSGIADATWGLDAGYLAIRGVCDYCDDAKNNTWQNHAAVVAAAYMRALLESFPALGEPGATAKPNRSPEAAGSHRTPREFGAAAAIAPSPPATIDRASGTDLIAPLVLLQLSDLHFGPHSRFAGGDLERLAAQCRQALDEARGDLGWGEAIGLVIVTGDIAEAARPPEYADAAMFFLALTRQLALSPHRFVFVPGNHDISWTKCSMVEGQLKDGEFPDSELRARLDAVKLAHFEKFVRDLHGGKARHEVDDAAVTSLPYGVFVHDFPDLGVSVAALNSCERESHRKEDHVGAMSAEQAQAVLDHWSRSGTELIRIAAVHHNPATLASAAIDQWLGFLRSQAAELTPDVVERIATNFVGFDGHEYLRNLASDAHASLILHGHHHASEAHHTWSWRGRDTGGAGDARIVSAGSWGLSPESGKLPKDQPVVMQLIRLDPSAAELHAVLLTYNPTARLPGEVRPGRFVLDPQTRANRPIGLSLPPTLRSRFRSEGASGDTPEVAVDRRSRLHASDLAAAIAHYRARKTGSFASWDLRTVGPHPTVRNRPVEITLDDMYTSLRFDAELDPATLDRGAPIITDDLVRPRRPLVVVGAAGSGKTTWMRWTFRRLIRDPRAVPFFLELRAIASAWKIPQGAGRAIDSYLADELTDCSIGDAPAVVAALLAEPSGLQPVILIDGWDELGAQGERVRERLVEFCSAFPHVVVVVSSRPYGDTRPAGAQAFETLYIQPLSDDDVRGLAMRFHRSVHGLDEPEGIRATDEFMAALAASRDARSLAGTALLLTMMLLLSREGPLPDRRHRLYTACLRNMLLHRVTQREHGGAVADRDQWRPDDSEERIRVVAELAYRMETEGYKQSFRGPIIRAWDAAADLLLAGKANRADQADWTPDQCNRFLRWLVATAGVLVDRADGSVHFAHLSLQEHLVAYHLHCTCEGDERVAMVRAHMGNRNWWETLRLWAGLTGDKGHDKLSPVLTMLREDPAGYWRAGMIFADGAGQWSDFEAWAADLATRLSEPFGPGDDDECAQAWKACKQADRRAVLAERLTPARGTVNWLQAIWHLNWCRLAGIDVPLAPTLLTLESPIDSAGATARSRARVGEASWPDSEEIAVLRIWPSARGRIGVRLQTAISLGAQVPEVMAMLPALVAQEARPRSDDRLAEILCRDLLQEYVKFTGQKYQWSFIQRFARDFSRDCPRYFGGNYNQDFGRFFAVNFFRKSQQCYNWMYYRWEDYRWEEEHGFVQPFRWSEREVAARHFGRSSLWSLLWDLWRSFAQNLVSDLGITGPLLDAPWLPGFTFLELGSAFGRAAPRAALAEGNIPTGTGVALLNLFHAACRASFAPDDASLRISVAHACSDFDGATIRRLHRSGDCIFFSDTVNDSLWPALARHVARISTPEDRALLEDLARHPEKRQPPLSWGLQYYVRGDLMFDDDSVVTLDELCAQAGLAPLPLIEPMPDELDIPIEDIPIEDAPP
jgi:hypothetical protein